jgi:hypothetical protein
MLTNFVDQCGRAEMGLPPLPDNVTPCGSAATAGWLGDSPLSSTDSKGPRALFTRLFQYNARTVDIAANRMELTIQYLAAISFGQSMIAKMVMIAPHDVAAKRRATFR